MPLNERVGGSAAEPVTHGIFISYRRDDTSGHVIALMDPLSARFGAERIFKDTDSIKGGNDYIVEVERQLSSSAVTLVVIGREWLTATQPGHPGRRLDDPKDLVRFEVATALAARDMLVIPVLVDRATMPAAEDLPEDLQALARRNGVELTDARWKADTDRLLRRIAEAMPSTWWQKVSAYAVHALTVAVLALSVLLMVLLIWDPFRSPDPKQSAAPPPSESPTPSGPPAPLPPAATDKDKATVEGGDAVRTSGVDKPSTTTAVPAGGGSKPPRSAGPTPTPKPQAAANTPRPTEPGPSTGTPPNSPPDISRGSQGGTAAPPPVDAPPRVNEEAHRASIRSVLERYRLAYNNKSEKGILEVYPKADARRLFREQSDCARVDLVFGEPQVFLSATEAPSPVNVPANLTCHPKNGQGAVVESFTDRFEFVRRGESWIIEARLAPSFLKR